MRKIIFYLNDRLKGQKYKYRKERKRQCLSLFENKENISGVTIHHVNENLDDGDIIIQKEVDISTCKSAQEIADKILKIEHQSLKEVIKKMEEEN